MPELHRRSLHSIEKKLNCNWTGNFLPARWVYSARGISRLEKENSCQRPSLAIHIATTQYQPTNATRAQLFQMQSVSVQLEGLLHKRSTSGTESQIWNWRGHGLSGDAATTALLHQWNLLGKHLLNTSVDTCRLLLQPALASFVMGVLWETHKTTSQTTAIQASCSMHSHRWRKPIQGLHQPLQDSREMLKGRQKERKSWMKGCRVV